MSGVGSVRPEGRPDNIESIGSARAFERPRIDAQEDTREMGIIERLCRDRQFREGLGKCRTRLFRMALAWSGCRATADDLVQETLTRALNYRHQLREIEKLPNWLFSILGNCWREHLRRQRPGVPLDEDQAVDWQCPEREHQRDDVVSRVRAEVARLPLGQRQVLTLVDLEGMSYAETAEIVGIPIGTVMSRLSRARATLRTALRDLHGEQSQTGRRLLVVK